MKYFQDNYLTLSEEKCKLIIKHNPGKNTAKCSGHVSMGSGNTNFWIIRSSVYKNYTDSKSALFFNSINLKQK